MPILREANAQDALCLAHFAEKTFREAFEAFNSPEDMELYCRSSFSAEVQKAEIEQEEGTTLLCLEGDSLAGFTQLRSDTRHDSVDSASSMEIRRLYVDAEWHGRGIAQRLMEAAISRAVESGVDALWLGVWENNPRAIAFYEKYGFSEVGENEFHLGKDRQRDIVMLLSPVSSPG